MNSQQQVSCENIDYLVGCVNSYLPVIINIDYQEDFLNSQWQVSYENIDYVEEPMNSQ